MFGSAAAANPGVVVKYCSSQNEREKEREREREKLRNSFVKAMELISCGGFTILFAAAAAAAAASTSCSAAKRVLALREGEYGRVVEDSRGDSRRQ